jgi:hypothetical protein
MPEITCPHCGYSLETAGSVATTCPRCESTLDFGEVKPLPSSPAVSPPDSSGPNIDMAALMRRVLAEQQAGEDFGAVLERIVQAEYPEDREKILKAIEAFLTFQQNRLGISRQQAAQVLSESTAQFTILPEGYRLLERFDLNQGMDKLAPEKRQQLQEQIEKAFREGKPLPVIQMGDLTPESRQRLLQLVKKSLGEGRPLPTPIIAGQEKVELTDWKIQIGKQIEEADREGKPIPTKINITVNLGKLSPGKILTWIALLLGCLVLAYLLSRR